MSIIKYATQCEYCSAIIGIASRDIRPTDFDFQYSEIKILRPLSSYNWHASNHGRGIPILSVKRVKIIK